MKIKAIILGLVTATIYSHVFATPSLTSAPALMLGAIPNMSGQDYCISTYPSEATCTLVYNTSNSDLILKFDMFPDKIKDKSHNVRGLVSDTGDYQTLNIKVYSNKNNLIYSGIAKNKVGLKCDAAACVDWL